MFEKLPISTHNMYFHEEMRQLSSFLGLKAASYLGQRNTYELTIYIKNNDYTYQCNGVKFQWDVKVLASFIFEEFPVGGEIPRELHKLIVLQIGT